MVDTGFDLGMLIILLFLVPRAGRLAMRIVERKVIDQNDKESKTHLAFAGVAVYIAQLVAYFVLFVFILQQLGFSLAGAAIPATAASAAIGLGAQSIIADFLAGFFILSERQFGVGDWVRFEGGAATVEGTVIQITMRATRIRTLAEETVIVPNSKAGVCVNSSNYWSKAVCKVSVPLLGSHSIYEAIDRAGQAAQIALKQPEVAEKVMGELDVHPNLAVNPPSTVGMPWTADMRFVVQVQPGTQWFVERAIRTEIINEFWREYGSAPTLSGAFAEDFQTAENAQTPSESSDSHPQQSVQNSLERVEGHEDPANEDDATVSLTRYNEIQPYTGWRRVITGGGKTRLSTAMLLGGLVVLLIFKGLTWSPDDKNYDGSVGILAPERFQSSSEPPSPARSTPQTPTPVPNTTTAVPENTQTPVPSSQVPSNSPEPTTSTPESTEESPLDVLR
ncbi:putative MscS family protein YkuT [Corynebacterium gerontici]|uniref:Putative MscS family protein YkuT n=2 Tax=Corynebacterium gerontici TaxID=2079234 RepID=A0A3G6J5H8_9CORY|nr:putative MscS family protein YkuT [Corynebacterium gerontici]